MLRRAFFTPSYGSCRSVVAGAAAKPRMATTIGRFTTQVENFHGRVAMIGLAGCALDETMSKMTVVQQFVTETGIPSQTAFAIVASVTTAFVLETFNPVTVKREEPVLDVFTNPGFTLETEVLHGRMAMLVFLYTLLSEQLYDVLVL